MARYLGLPLLALACLWAVFSLNSLMVDVQWEEMDRLLSQAPGEEAALESSTLWGRLNLVKQRLQNGETPVENYVLEARIQALTTAQNLVLPPKTASWKAGLVGVFRMIFGRTALLDLDQASLFLKIEKAYFYEITKKYTKAAEAYGQMFRENSDIPENLKLRIRLHWAFCLALGADKSQALEVFLQIQKEHPGTDGALLATQAIELLKNLGEFQKTSQSQGPGPGQVRDYYLSMEFQKSLDEFEKLPQKDDPQARYYKGRSHEELGQSEEAQSEFRRVIFLDPEGPWGHEARRRLVMQEKVYDQPTELTARATKELEKKGDQEFFFSLNNYPGRKDPSKKGEAPEGGNFGELYISSQPPGAQVILNGVIVGTSPLFITEVPKGKTTLEVRLGSEKVFKEVTVASRDIQKVHFNLGAVPGRIILNSRHTITAIFLDGREVASLEAVIPGGHNLLIQAKKSSGETIIWDKEIEISPGQTLLVEVP